ncbi:averantin hydroxylase [Colletotrichum spaethianum]|uniref:Averantin hydroxylase n=1 Tax=Colletotrichum spaethianum TaxID=700344 RepID=A0AA37PF38_9PEZI|nr:averantin hydroxylase [Colletotrichum spaethianum]GKT51125.1 averantin hydroxylase [Colletotrichum spaethianum]
MNYLYENQNQEKLKAFLDHLPAFNTLNVIKGLGLAFVGYIVLVKIIYNLYFHPLRNYPGPKLWAISRIPWHHTNLKGRISWRIRELHDEYGPVVRIAPDELSYTTSTAWKKIYGQRKPEFPKALDGRGIAPPSIGGRLSLMTETQDQHLRLRRAINPAFSEKALREQEHYLQTHSSNLIRILKEKSKQGPVDMTTWYNLVAFDIVSDLAFGEPAGFLDNADQPWIKVILDRAKAIVWFQLAVWYGFFPLLNLLTPRYVTESRKNHIALTEAKLERRIKAENPGKDFMSFILENENEAVEKLSKVELVMLASNFIVAGSGTSAGGMSGLTYLLLRNPDKLEKLKKEIRERFQSSDEISMQGTAQCKYLNACLDEGMRMYPPTPGSLPRFVPGSGEIIDGKWVKGGMAVAVNQLSAGTSELNFKRAREFHPERWLDLSPDSEFANDDKAATQPFSMGQRVCIGRAMAYAEMRLTMAKIMWHFDLELSEPELDWWNKQGTYLVWEKIPLMIQLRPRFV